MKKHTVDEAAKILGVAIYTVRRYIREGKIKAEKVKIGLSNRTRYKIDETEIIRVATLLKD